MKRAKFIKAITLGTAAIVAGVKAAKKFAGWDVGYILGSACLYDAEGVLIKKWVGDDLVYDSQRDIREGTHLIKNELLTPKEIKKRYPKFDINTLGK